MELTFQDTLTRRESRLSPSSTNPLQMYICGPTVYAPPHVGHARTYLLFDMVKRFFLVQRGLVRHVQNITDFEDKITMRANVEGITWQALSRRETAEFDNRMSALGVLRPDFNPQSSHYVKMMISLIRRLEKQGFTYAKRRSIYFDTSSSTGARNFSADEFLSAHAIPEPGMEALPEAEDPRDFALWKPSRPPAPCWDSPWGRGMPGWHIECYAMASRHLTLPMDIHGGGMDLIFPHHYAENLICMALNGTAFSKNFLHDAVVTMDAMKMAKSTGNLVNIEEALEEVSPGGLRTYLLSKGYGERLEFSMYEACQVDEGWMEDHATFLKLLSHDGHQGYPLQRLERGLKCVTEAMGRDLGTAEALEALHRVAEDIRGHGSSALDSGDRSKGRQLLAYHERLLGLPLLRESKVHP
jgi:cysteinyl-tRNA synthetase